MCVCVCVRVYVTNWCTGYLHTMQVCYVHRCVHSRTCNQTAGMCMQQTPTRSLVFTVCVHLKFHDQYIITFTRLLSGPRDQVGRRGVCVCGEVWGVGCNCTQTTLYGYGPGGVWLNSPLRGWSIADGGRETTVMHACTFELA